MKEKQAIKVTLLLSYLVLATGGIEIRSVKQREFESTSNILPYTQVNKTIQIEGGDVYDCVDVNLQPAFNHPLLKDHKIQMEPSSFPVELDIKSPSMHVISQAQPAIVECPIGTVPILRNNRRDHMAALNIDEAISKDLQQEAAGIKYFDDIYGIRATINVYEPKVKKENKDHSASWMQINKGPKVGDSDGLGAGSAVAPTLSGDSFARFHVAWDDGVLNKSCTDHICPGFVQVSHSVGLGGRLQHVSVYNGPQYVIKLLIFKDPKTNNWWLAYGEKRTLIGYWPSSLFTYLKDKGEYALWGGHVQGPTASLDSPQMGSGHFAEEGYGKAAFTKDILIVDENNRLVKPNANKAHPGSTDLSKYTVDDYGVDNNGMHVYYGGPGVLV